MIVFPARRCRCPRCGRGCRCFLPVSKSMSLRGCVRGWLYLLRLRLRGSGRVATAVCVCPHGDSSGARSRGREGRGRGRGRGCPAASTAATASTSTGTLHCQSRTEGVPLFGHSSNTRSSLGGRGRSPIRSDVGLEPCNEILCALCPCLVGEWPIITPEIRVSQSTDSICEAGV